MAALLFNLGVAMNPTSGQQVSNTFEDKELQLFHERVIGDWKKPRPYNWLRYRNEYLQLIKERAIQPLWGFKDPRIAFMFGDVINTVNVYDSDIRVVHIMRHPLESAMSLMRANPGLDYDQAMDITFRYVAAIDKALERFIGLLTGFHYRKVLLLPDEEIKRLARFLGVDYRPEIADIVHPELCHFKWEEIERKWNIVGMQKDLNC
ncbi:MAG: hypothetical protein GF334_00640 [Candidatus Altiarchaeales archaeon]|nr:hypothetical protein [Candidatus Altiarchaeales archaeon]